MKMRKKNEGKKATFYFYVVRESHLNIWTEVFQVKILNMIWTNANITVDKWNFCSKASIAESF